MKHVLPLFAALLLSSAAVAQAIPVELHIGNHYTLYQHTINKPLSATSRFGVVHIANIIDWYNNDVTKNGMKNETMNQGYISYRLSNAFSVLGGFFYTNATGLRGAAGLQFTLSGKNWLMVVMPRADISAGGALELFGMLEYRPELAPGLKLYTRIQGMTNNGPDHHNRSYQRLRLGLDAWKTQFGFAYSIDQYGADPLVKQNTGIFIRKEIK